MYNPLYNNQVRIYDGRVGSPYPKSSKFTLLVKFAYRKRLLGSIKSILPIINDLSYYFKNGEVCPKPNKTDSRLPFPSIEALRSIVYNRHQKRAKAVANNKKKGVDFLNNVNVGNNQWILKIDFSQLMDLRVDYAFKLIFGMGNTLFLISLLNAVFANKKIPRIIKSITVDNPYLEKYSKDDKLSILDIRARLDDGSTILIEMHLYDLDDLKYKTIRSWARAYGEKLKSRETYSSQPPVICVTFANGSLDEGESKKVHKCCKIKDIDDNTIFTDALELHYIDMSLFVKMINKKGGITKDETLDSVFEKWLTVITEKDIEDKTIIKNICEEQEEIGMAVSALVTLSEDVIIRHAYERRQDEIGLFNNRVRKYTREIEEMNATIADKDATIAANEATIADKDATIAEQLKLIAELRLQRGKA